MSHTMIVQASLACALWLAALGGAACADSGPRYTEPPGVYSTSWIGNSFGGAGGGNGFGQWVQDGVDAMAVSPDGTVFAGVEWDEAGRCVGLYKDGQPNHVLVRADDSPAKAWGWNTGNRALGVDGSFFYVANSGKGLLRFQWTPGDIDSAKYIDQAALPESASSLSCGDGKIVVVYSDKIEARGEADLKTIATYPISGATHAVLAPDVSLWVIVDGKVRHYDSKGKEIGDPLPGIDNPSSLAWDNRGRLIVCDNGPAQQVLFFSVTGKPELVSTFGIRLGLYSGTPGTVAPQKLFALQGAASDARGNLYVAMSFGDGSPQGNCFLRAFSPSGKLLWENHATAFVDTFGFDPKSDGAVVYGRTTKWDLDLGLQKPGTEATLKAITLDPLRFPDDPRLKNGYSVYPRTVQGVRLVYMIGQTGGGFLIYAKSADSEILHQIGRTPSDQGWAWDVTPDGDIWDGDAPGDKIVRYRLTGITAGRPVYDWEHPEEWPYPADFATISRVIYSKETDSLYIFGYLKGQATDSWGVVGFTGRRYDGWLSGKPTVCWTNTSLPASANGMGEGKPLSAKTVALAGDYLFFGMVKDDTPAPRTHILSAIDGRYVGTFTPGRAVGGVGGWEDMAGSIQATRRANGEYLVLVEEDWRAKNLLYRWKP